MEPQTTEIFSVRVGGNLYRDLQDHQCSM